MSRLLPDFLDAYSSYTENTESAKIFHSWVGISIISSVLRKKVKLCLGRIRVYPNTYIVLVADPGKARKSVAISFGSALIKSIDDIKISADAITREALLQDLETCAVDSRMPDGKIFKHSSLSIISTEFESFLGQKVENAKMLVLLTDLFDCAETPWRYRTKNSGNTVIPSVFLNVLGATTPDSLATSLPPTAIGGGLTSRIFFIWADKKDKKVPIPFETSETMDLREKLKKDLFAISQICGDYILTPEAVEYWNTWYMKYEDLDINRICTDPSFNGWYSRKPMLTLKIAMILAASESSNLELTPAHLEKALTKVEETETGMGNAFRSVGKSAITGEVDTVLNIIRTNRIVKEQKLMRDVWRDMDSVKFTNVIDTILKTGRVKKTLQADGMVFYEYVSD